MKRIILASAAVLSLSTLGVTAASADQVDRIQAQQAQQIRRGIATGQITRNEARDLNAEQRRIAELERRVESDGRVTAAERARLASAQRDAGRHIAQESHDSQRSWFRRWW